MEILESRSGEKRKATHDSGEMAESAECSRQRKRTFDTFERFSRATSWDPEDFGVLIPSLVKKESRAKAIVGTNHRRAEEVPSYNVLEYAPLSAALQQSRQAPQLRTRDTREAALPLKPCRRRRSLSPSHGSRIRILEHEGPEMFGSPNRLVEHQSFRQSIKQRPVEDLTSDRSSKSPSPEIPETQAESVHSDENEGQLVEVIRVKERSNTGKPRAQHSSAILPPIPLADLPLPPTHGNARKQTIPAKDLDKQGKPHWAAFSRYHGQLGASLPDFGGPQEAAAVSPTAYKMKKRFGAPQPRNTLSSGAQPSMGPAASSQNYPKHFDLSVSNPDKHKDKRQRTEGLRIRNGSSVVDSIDLEASDTTSHRSQKLDRTFYHSQEQRNSRQSSQKNTLDGQPSHHQVVNDKMTDARNRNTRRREVERTNGISDSQSARSKSSSFSNGSADVMMLHGFKHKPENRSLEDSDDPIAVDPEGEVVLANTVDPKDKSPSVQVVIESRSDSKKAAKRGSNVNGSNSYTGGRHTGPTSEYFPSKAASSRRQSLDSDVDFQSPTSSRVGTRRNGAHVDSHKDSDLQYQYEIPKNFGVAVGPKMSKNLLLREQSPSNILVANSEGSKARASRALSAASSSATKNGSAPNRSKSKASQSSKVFNFQVLRLFSESEQWLSGDTKEAYILRADLDTGDLSFDDSQRKSRFTIYTKSGIQIKKSEHKPKFFFLKNIDENPGVKICLELAENTEMPALVNMLKKNTNKFFELPDEKMEKIFSTTLTQGRTPTGRKRNRRISENESQEVQFLSARLEHRDARGLAANGPLSSRKRPATRASTVEDSEEDELASQPVAKGLSKRMRRNSSLSIEEKERRGIFGSNIPSTNFHTKNSSSQPAANGVSKRRRPNSSSSIEETEPRGMLGSGITPDKFYSNNPTSPGPRTYNTYETRSSARKNSPTSASKVQVRQRTPSPERWTHLNRGWEAEWKGSVIYPREGKKKATVDMQDIERLDEGEFLNDNLISFYLRWLEDRLEQEKPDLATRIYFHNTFFFANLTKDVKARGINYEAVKRWTAKIDQLSYDYIIVPVNEATHWYVMIICNAPKLLASNVEEPTAEVEEEDPNGHRQPQELSTAPKVNDEVMDIDGSLKPNQNHKSDDEGKVNDALQEGRPSGMEDVEDATKANEDFRELDVAMADVSTSTMSNELNGVEAKQSEIKATPGKKGKKKPSRPPQRKEDPEKFRIIALDSLGISRNATAGKLRDYIIAEIKEKHNQEISVPNPFFTKASTLPQQNNYYDCGVFLLEYIERFLKGPDEFIRKILQKEKEDADDVQWLQQSGMRTHIRKLVLQLQREQALELQRLKKEKKPKRKGEKGPAPAPAPGPTANPTISQAEKGSVPSPAAKSSIPQISLASKPSDSESTKAQAPISNSMTAAKDTEIAATGEANTTVDNQKKSASDVHGTGIKWGIKNSLDVIFKSRQKANAPTQPVHPNENRQTAKPAQLGRTKSDAVSLIDSPPPKINTKIDPEPCVQESANVNTPKLERSPSDSRVVVHSPDSPITLPNETQDNNLGTKSRSESILISDDETEKHIIAKHGSTSKPSMDVTTETMQSDYWAPEDQIQFEAAKTRSTEDEILPLSPRVMAAQAKQITIAESPENDETADTVSFVKSVTGASDGMSYKAAESYIPHYINLLNPDGSDIPSSNHEKEEFRNNKTMLKCEEQSCVTKAPAKPTESGYHSDTIQSSPREGESLVLSSAPSTPLRTISTSRTRNMAPASTAERRDSSQRPMRSPRHQKSNSSLRDAADPAIIGKHRHKH